MTGQFAPLPPDFYRQVMTSIRLRDGFVSFGKKNFSVV
jgi:hypothetical protein